MRTIQDLIEICRRIDGRGYKAYRELRGDFECDHSTLSIDHVQGDPFAAPTRVRARVPMTVAQLPTELHGTRPRRIAFADFLARGVQRAIRELSEDGRMSRGSGKSGLIAIDAGGQEVLERSAVVLNEHWVEARLEIGLPAAGRRVLGREAEQLLTQALVEIVRRGLHWRELPGDEARRFVHCVENQEFLRSRLRELGLIAFVGNGAILPRESGISQRPLPTAEAVPFLSPASLEVEIDLPNPIAGEASPRSARGMGVPRGITLIVGGGYHGKSTLLRALERGIHPHIPGDGREWVVSDEDLVKVRAEDGRSVACVDISAFISDLPGGSSTSCFSTEMASGSTSQAAAIAEATEAGASGLLLDEDTSATNFMIRDERMRQLVRAEDEPITPFLDRVRELREQLGISSVLVMGGSGDYFDVADRVIAMRAFRPEDVTSEARLIAEGDRGSRRGEPHRPLEAFRQRVPLADAFDASRESRRVKIGARGREVLIYGRQDVDLRGVEQLVDPSQTRAIGFAIQLAGARLVDGRMRLSEVLDRIEALLDEKGLDALDPAHRPGEHPGNLARPRRFEIAAAMSRLRGAHLGAAE